MPLMPTVGNFLPGNGFVNSQNSPYADGTGDPVTGLSSYQGGGLYPGRAFQLSDAEAAALDVNAATAVTLFGGIYQWVQLDSGATGMAQGQCLFWKQSSLGNGLYTVTNAASGNEPLIAGVLVNVAANLPTAGNYFCMFVGPGRVQVLMNGTFTGTAASRDPVGQKATTNTFDDLAGITAPTMAELERFVGISEIEPVISTLITVQWSRYFTRA